MGFEKDGHNQYVLHTFYTLISLPLPYHVVLNMFHSVVYLLLGQMNYMNNYSVYYIPYQI